jgi:hypothetical protein
MKKNTETAAAGERLSVDAYLALIKRDLDSWKWDAVLVYDRAKTNTILLQEYIKRFSKESWLPGATFDVSTPTKTERVIDYRLDKPRVSFENANLGSSRLDLHMKVIGGKQITIENPDNIKKRQVTRLKMADALNGPVLHARVTLQEVNVELSDGRVGVDLSEGTNYYLTYSDSDEEDEAGGKRLKEVFESWLGEQKIFELSNMPRTDNIIEPESITIRTQASSDSNVLGAASAGDGAVLVFVALRGNDSELSLPGENYSYFLPGGPGEFSAVMNFSTVGIFKRIVPQLARTLAQMGIQFNADYSHGMIRATSGYRFLDGVRIVIPGEPNNLTIQARGPGAVFAPVRIHPDHHGELTISVEGSDVVLRWVGEGRFGATAANDFTVVGSGFYVYNYTCTGTYSLVLKPDGTIRFVLGNKHFTSTLVADGWSHPRATEYMEKSGYKTILDDEAMPTLLKGFEEIDTEINLFLLNNLLFEGDQVFQMESAHIPGPVVALGQISPELTAFQVDPVETIVGAGRTFKFKTTGADVPVTWSVANLPDGSGKVGDIDPDTGEYTAPVGADLPDTQKRVLVTAKAKSGNAVSQALVGIVNRDIGLDPLVLMAGLGARGYKVRGTPLDASEVLTFKMSDGALGTVDDDPDADPDVRYSKLYVPPAGRMGVAAGPQPIPAQWLEYRKTSAWTLEEELSQYLHFEQVIAEGSNGNRKEVDVLLVMQNITNWFDFKHSGNGIQLEHWSNKKSGDYVVPKEKTFWVKVKGSGTLVDGVYTPDPSADESYAVIVAIEEDDTYYKWVPAILPIPFMGVETYLDMLQEDLK